MKTLQMLIVLILVALMSHAQVYEQSYFLNMMPKIPTKVISVTDAEQEAFEAQIKSLECYLDSLAAIYKHPTCSLEKASQQDMFEFDEIWNELYLLHQTQFEYDTQISEELNILAQEEYAKKDALSDKLRIIINQSAKTMKDTSRDENRIDKEMYDNHASYNQKRADLLTKVILHYRALLDNFASKAKRADTILLAVLTKENQYPCAAITNAQHLLLAYRGYLSLFVSPYTPKFN